MKFESFKPRENTLDEDLRYLETLPDNEEKLKFIRSIIKNTNSIEGLSLIKNFENIGIRHFVLPNIPGGDLKIDIKKIRESYDSKARCFKSHEHIFTDIGQGEMWIFPKKEKPYFKISMSECSAIIASNNEIIIVAHISYSEIDEIKAVVEFIKNNGIELKNIHVIASLGDFQIKKSENETNKRATNISSYTDLGIQENNIIEFEFYNEDGLLKNITQVMGYDDAMLKYSLDIEAQTDEMVGDYRDEEIIII